MHSIDQTSGGGRHTWLPNVLAAIILFHVLAPFGWMAPFVPGSADAAAADSGNLRYMAYTIYAFAAFIITRYPIRAFAIIKKPTLISLIIVFAHLSFFWSIAPTLTLQFLIRFDFLVLMLVALTANWGLMGAFRMFSRVGMVIILLSVVLNYIIPGTMRDEAGALHGFFSHKNSMGAFAANVAAFTLAEYLFSSQRGWRIPAISLCVCAVYLSQSATGLVLLVLDFSVVGGLFLTSKVRNDQRFVVISILLLICLITMLAIAVEPEAFLRAGLDRNISFTGRTRVWQVSAQLISQNPVLGFGYHVIGDPNNKVGAALLAFGSSFTHPHNGWLATGLQLGLIGIFFQLIFFVYLTYLGLRYWWRDPKQLDGVLILVFTIGLWVRAVPESDFLLIPSFENAIMIIVGWTAGSLHKQRVIRRQRVPIFDLLNAPDAIKRHLPEVRSR